MAAMMLTRQIGTFGATMMGLGSIVGTGVFISIGIAAGIAGPAAIVAIAIAAMVATCNALSSAQLAATHPVSGGTYEYGYKYLSPMLGFAAGWTFLCAKVASAATAALGFAGYLSNSLGIDADWNVALAIITVASLTAIVLRGVQLSSRVNIAIVGLTITSLFVFVAAGASHVSAVNLNVEVDLKSLLHSAALMFVAFTGYGRIATLGEEVIEPKRTIPRAIVITLLVSMVLYMGVALVAIGSVGAVALSEATTGAVAPLEVVSRTFQWNVHWIVALGAMTAMLGVLLNLILGLSRVLLAMGRRGDMPRIAQRLGVCIIAVGGLICAVAATGSVKFTWSFSALTVLIYYAVTNLAALQLEKSERLFSRGWAISGLVACLGLAFAIEWRVWIIGAVLLSAGIALHAARRRYAR